MSPLPMDACHSCAPVFSSSAYSRRSPLPKITRPPFTTALEKIPKSPAQGGFEGGVVQPLVVLVLKDQLMAPVEAATLYSKPFLDPMNRLPLSYAGEVGTSSSPLTSGKW